MTFSNQLVIPPAEAPRDEGSVVDATLVTRTGLYVHDVPQISTCSMATVMRKINLHHSVLNGLSKQKEHTVGHKSIQFRCCKLTLRSLSW